MKKFVILIIVILAISLIVYLNFFKKKEADFSLAEVVRGAISQEISETGQIKKGDKINLTFKNTGKIEKIYVKVGEEVKEGDVLAKLETEEMQIKLREAKSNLAAAQAKFNKLLAGAAKEEIQAEQTKINNSQIALNTANQTLKDAYEDGLVLLDDAYLKVYNSKNTADAVYRTYFVNNDQIGIKVKENRDDLENAAFEIKSYLDSAKANSSYENIDITLPIIKRKLIDASNYLKTVREASEDINYRNLVSSTDKTSLDAQRANINTVLTNIANSQQSIASAKLGVSSAEGELQAAKDNLALTAAPPRQEDIDLERAQIAKAQTQSEFYENQIREAKLISPIDGQVAEINKEVGELIQPSPQDIAVTILPFDPYEIELDIYEEDIVKVNTGNPSEISLIAFPGKTFKGKVLSISPAEKIIDGVIYYETIIGFEEMPEGLKPGMTADVIIQTASKDNVLIISKDAVLRKNGKAAVEVLKGKIIEEKEIKIGLEGKDNMVEILSGLEAGEKAVIR